MYLFIRLHLRAWVLSQFSNNVYRKHNKLEREENNTRLLQISNFSVFTSNNNMIKLDYRKYIMGTAKIILELNDIESILCVTSNHQKVNKGI